MALLPAGATIAGYRIDALIGRGGMGLVYRAFELELERVVALKVIAPELVEDPDTRRRFLTETRAASHIEHPHVIPVYAAGERDGVAFIAMRFIDGTDLRVLVKRSGALEPAHAAALIEHTASALDAIHAAGFVHRDVKPANVLVDATGHPYLTDFGLAKEVITQATPTRSGQWVGTLDYIAPEQVRGGRIDARADIYSLGGVLHFLLTGSVPYEREREEAKLWAQLSDPPPVPSRVRPGVPAVFDAVVARAMAKDPDERYRSAGDLGRAARAVADGKPEPPAQRVVARARAAPAGAAELSTVTAGVAPSRPRRRVALAAGAVVALAAGGVAVALLGHGETPAAAPGAAVPTPTAVARATPTPAGARVAATIARVGERPTGIAIAHGQPWVSSFRRTALWIGLRVYRKVLKLNLRTGVLTYWRTLPAPVYALHYHARALWATLRGQDTVVRMDVRGHGVVSGAAGHGPAQLVATGGRLFVASRNDHTVLVLDPRTLTPVQRPVHVGLNPFAVAAAGHSVWVTTIGDDSVTRIDYG